MMDTIVWVKRPLRDAYGQTCSKFYASCRVVRKTVNDAVIIDTSEGELEVPAGQYHRTAEECEKTIASP